MGDTGRVFGHCPQRDQKNILRVVARNMVVAGAGFAVTVFRDAHPESGYVFIAK